jgi:hypothetical protein
LKKPKVVEAKFIECRHDGRRRRRHTCTRTHIDRSEKGPPVRPSVRGFLRSFSAAAAVPPLEQQEEGGRRKRIRKRIGKK